MNNIKINNNTDMKNFSLCIFSAVMMFPACSQENTIVIDKDVLLDKIKGGWAGQTFGCTYGGPTEFKYNGRMIDDTVTIKWPEKGYCKWYYENQPGLYDDIYMDLTFVDVIDRYGVDAPVDSFAMSFARAEYKLWHANQAARYNILNGLKAPECGHWKNNPHADDIDFQIEADFAGLMTPGMPVSSLEICDKIGHIMNYGDGWYGGVYVATMYSLAFVMDDVKDIVNEAMKAIPEESDYHKCISDVIKWCSENSDWKDTWKMIEDKWGYEMNCPQGIEDPFNIDAKLNSAYVVVGLLYGNGDMDKTIDISTRCGADSDCNPATAAGILGTVLGYSNISDKWISHIKEVEDMDFAHTDISLNETYEMGLRHALEMIEKGGGSVNGNKVTIKLQKPVPARFEKSFEGLSLVKKDEVQYRNFKKQYTYDFTGSAVVCEGKLNAKKECPRDYVAKVEVIIDGNREIVNMPADFATRRVDIYWNYDLKQGDHEMKIMWLNPVPYANLVMHSVVVYEDIAK